jgi:Holliday junction resolvase
MKKESALQRKIMKRLEEDGHITIKIVVANKGGNSDIVGCAKNGKFFSVEVKDDDKPTPLQEYKIKLYRENNGISFWCKSYVDFLCSYEKVKADLGV